MKQLVMINGKLCVGKTTLAKKLSEKFGYDIWSISVPINRVAALLIEDHDKLNAYLTSMIGDQTPEIFRKLTEEFNRFYIGSKWQKNENGHYIKNQSYRSLTQMVATTVRNQLGKAVWVEFLAKDALAEIEKGNKIICDDARLKSEKDVFETYGFATIRLDVSKEEQQNRIQSAGYGKIKPDQLEHMTEIDLDDDTFDLRFDTTEMTAEQVAEKVEGFLKNEN